MTVMADVFVSVPSNSKEDLLLGAFRRESSLELLELVDALLTRTSKIKPCLQKYRKQKWATCDLSGVPNARAFSASNLVSLTRLRSRLISWVREG